MSAKKTLSSRPLWSCLMRLRKFHRVLTLMKSFRLRFSTTPIKKNSYCLCSKQYRGSRCNKQRKLGNLRSARQCNPSCRSYRRCNQLHLRRYGQTHIRVHRFGRYQELRVQRAEYTQKDHQRTQSDFYDSMGRITGYTSPEGAVSYTYDANGNVLTVTDSPRHDHRNLRCSQPFVELYRHLRQGHSL